MPKKERPSALSDSIFRAKLEQAPDDLGRIAEEIPVHNTFIQFAAPPSAQSEKKQLSTAPAWIGPSFQSMLQQASAELPPQAALPGQEGDSLEDEASLSPEELLLGSPKKIPVMRYALSTSSARAAGLPDCSPESVAFVGPTKIFESLEGSQECEADEGDGDGDGDDDDADTADGNAPAPVPFVPSGPLPSMGSALHAEGACKRCCFFPKGRCLNGQNCEFCHFEHEKRKRKKKKKSASARRDSGGSDSEDDSDAGDDAPGKAATTSQTSNATGPAVSTGVAPADASTGSARAGLPLTAPPPLPPRGLPVPTEPPPPAPNPAGHVAPLPLSADQYYGGGYDAMPPGMARPGASPFPAYGNGAYAPPVDARLPYYAGGYDPAAVAAQQQQAAALAAYQQPSQGRYLPPPR